MRPTYSLQPLMSTFATANATLLAWFGILWVGVPSDCIYLKLAMTDASFQYVVSLSLFLKALYYLLAITCSGETEIKDDDVNKEELLDYDEGDEKAPYSAAMSANENSIRRI
nr:hypothetical protein [Tanacetum cinerariifolium]